jgi:hypothetical protein
VKPFRRLTIAFSILGIGTFFPSPAPSLTGPDPCEGAFLACWDKEDWVCILPEFLIIKEDACDGRSPGCKGWPWPE